MMSAHSINSATGAGLKPNRCSVTEAMKLRAGTEIGIVELRIAQLLLEVRGIFGGKKCALMMIEPPGNARRRRILEIHDGVFVAGEVIFVEERTGTMHQPLVFEFGVLANALAVKTA